MTEEATPTPEESVLCNHPNLADALSHAQSDFPIVPKNHTAEIRPKDSPAYTYQYADAGDIIEAVKPILYRCGLSVTQPVDFKGTTDYIRTVLMHMSGERIVSRMRLKLEQPKPQATGSLITFFRRYAYCAILGIVSDKDDDGALAQAAYGEESPRSRRRAAPKSSTPTTKTSQTPARVRTDPATDGKEGMSLPDRNKVTKHFNSLDPPVRGDKEVMAKVNALLEPSEPFPALVKLTVEDGVELFRVLGIS